MKSPSEMFAEFQNLVENSYKENLDKMEFMFRMSDAYLLGSDHLKELSVKD